MTKLGDEKIKAFYEKMIDTIDLRNILAKQFLDDGTFIFPDRTFDPNLYVIFEVIES